MENKVFKHGSSGKKPSRYPQEIKEQAVSMYMRTRPDFSSNGDCAESVCDLLGIGCRETLISWVKQSEIDAGRKEGISTSEREEIRRLQRENAELKRANGILKAASAFFAAELDRPQNR